MKFASRISSIRRQAWKTLQLVLARTRPRCGATRSRAGARRVDPLAAGLEHARDRVLREPVDLELRLERPQLARDRDVAPRVAEPDRRRDEQRALARRTARAPAARRRARRRTRARRSRAHQVEPHRVRRVGAVPDALQLDQLARRSARRTPPPGRPGSGGRRRPASRATGSAAGRAARAISASSRSAELERLRERLGRRLERPSRSQSSICLVECGSGKQRPKKNSR